MEVFISWSGERSRILAAAISELLPDVLQDLRVWMSEHDINAGSRWGHELHQKLESSNFGVLCLTPENVNAPWLLFEAGSLAKSVSSARVVPYRLKLSATDVSFPLAQFQGVDADEIGTKKLIQSLNTGLKQPLEGGRLDRLFQRAWPDLATRITAIPETLEKFQAKRPDRELLEEILKLVRHGARATAGGWEIAIVKWFNRVKGFGFLTRGEGTEDILLLMETVGRYGLEELKPGDSVLVRYSDGPKGLIATEVRPLDSKGPAAH